MLSTVISIVVFLYLCYQLYFIFSKKNKNFFLSLYKEVFRNFRLVFIPIALATIVLVITVSLALYNYLPFGVGKFSILNLFGLNGGNILTGANIRSNDSSSSYSHVFSTVLSIVTPLVLFILIPVFAYSEEVFFRKSSQKLSFMTSVLECLKFGLFHLIVGVPVSAALALSIGGGVFMMAYRHKYSMLKKSSTIELGVKEEFDLEQLLEESACYYSAALHSVYNFIIMTILVSLTVYIVLQ